MWLGRAWPDRCNRAQSVRIPLLCILVAVGACGAEDALIGKDCTSTEDQTWDLQNPDTPTEFKIESCRIDVDACPALCTYVLTQHSVSGSATGCEVEFEGGITHVTASYQVFNGGPNCPVFEDDQPGGF